MMPTKEKTWTSNRKKRTELPQGPVPSCLVYWPSCFQTAANEKQQKPIDKERRGVSMETITEQGRGRQRRAKEGASLQLPGRPKWETEAVGLG